jgi:hypothetical protein
MCDGAQAAPRKHRESSAESCRPTLPSVGSRAVLANGELDRGKRLCPSSTSSRRPRHRVVHAIASSTPSRRPRRRASVARHRQGNRTFSADRSRRLERLLSRILSMKISILLANVTSFRLPGSGDQSGTACPSHSRAQDRLFAGWVKR